MKRAVSISLGSSKRDFLETLDLLGQEVRVERIGTDGDQARAAELIRELDSAPENHVGAIGLGGIDLYLYIGRKRYPFRDAQKLAAQAKHTPVVCGAGIKNTLERRVVERLNTAFSLEDKKVFMVSAGDRWGMAEALSRTGAEVHYGDFISLLGLPLPIRNLNTSRVLGHALMPIFRHLPIRWIYPTGNAQEQDGAGNISRFYAWADVIAGDWHLVRRHLPPHLDGKIILTNTTTAENVQLLRERGAKLLVTTTPRLNGRSIPTNMLEAALITASGSKLLTLEETDALVRRAGLMGEFVELQSPTSSPVPMDA